VAADANTALQTYPDQSLYPCDSVPKVWNAEGGRLGGWQTFRVESYIILSALSGFAFEHNND